MNLKQKQILSTYFPELSTYRNVESSPVVDTFLIALVNKIESVKGERGTDGKTPKKGEDYFTPQELKEIVTYIRDTSIPEEILRKATPIKGKHYNDGKDGRDGRPGLKGEQGEMGLMGRPGKDGSPDSPLAIANKLNSLEGILNAKVIDGVVSKEEFKQQSKKVLDGMARVDGRIKLIDQRWRGGGGVSQVYHDTTLTGLGTPSSPLSVVGGGSGSTTAVETPSGTINGVNATFTVLYVPLWIVINGVSYFVNNGYTISGGTITIDSSIIPATSSILRSINNGVAVSGGANYLTDANGNILTDSNGVPLTVN